MQLISKRKERNYIQMQPYYTVLTVTSCSKECHNRFKSWHNCYTSGRCCLSTRETVTQWSGYFYESLSMLTFECSLLHRVLQTVHTKNMTLKHTFIRHKRKWLSIEVSVPKSNNHFCIRTNLQ